MALCSRLRFRSTGEAERVHAPCGPRFPGILRSQGARTVELLPALLLALLLTLFSVRPGQAQAEPTRVRMTGDWYAYATSFTNRNFTGKDTTGTQTEDALAMWQRLRLRTDISQGDSLGFTLWLQVDNTPWGNNTYAVDNPAVEVETYMAYLQFTVPGSKLVLTAGLQGFTLPQSEAFNGSVVADTQIGALTASFPLSDFTQLKAGYGRLFSYNDFLATGGVKPHDLFDLAFLALPNTRENFSVSPWAVLGLSMRDGQFRPYQGISGPPNVGYMRTDLLSLGYFAQPLGYRQATVPYYWGGAAFQAVLAPFTLYGDAVLGQGGAGDRARNLRQGLFVDAALEYNRFDKVTPRLSGWWSSGEDDSLGNGSERMPALVCTWNLGTSYLFSTGQVFDNTTSIAANPIGAWGLGFTLDNITFVDSLSSRLGLVRAQGTSSPKALRQGLALTGPGVMLAMGKTLAQGEGLTGVNFDHQYTVCENLKLVAETGWARADGLKASIWGNPSVKANKDSWKVAAGLQYKF